MNGTRTVRVLQLYRHIQLCSDFRAVRNNSFVASCTSDLFEKVDVQNIVDFIKETDFALNHNCVVSGLLQDLS